MSDAVDILGLTCAQVQELATFQDLPAAGRARAVWARALRSGELAPEACGMAARSAQAWREAVRLELPRLVRSHSEDGPFGPTTKLIFATHDDYEMEAVRFPLGHTPTLCTSSQVGCRMGCTFCETGKLGLIRNLTAAEIIGQVVAAARHLGEAPRRIVFMGMGEACDNIDHVIQALHVLTDRGGLDFAHERLTICTSGHIPGLKRLMALGWKRLGLALSLNAADDRTRARIMPVTNKHSLAELQELLADYRPRANFTWSINYCLLPGINDSAEDAERIAAFCAPIPRVLLNLIPYNPGSDPLTRAPEEAEIHGFIDLLRANGLPVRRRITKGRTIMAACGQLGNVELREQARQRRRAERAAPTASN